MTPVYFLRAILGPYCQSDREAEAVLERANSLGVDPLDICASRSRLSEDAVFSAAAGICGLAFSPVMPENTPLHAQIVRVDALATIRTIRATLLDRDVLFTAPGFEELLALGSHLKIYPELARRICVVPARALRAGLLEGNKALLMDEARQRLARRWPFASAHLDLGLISRIFFVAALAALILVVSASPLWMSPFLLPLLALVLVLPSLFRLYAALKFFGREPVESAPLLSDADLPVYSVLIPLRDEANMVPLLTRAMRALDYPPEKLDIKFVVEAKSAETVAAARQALADPQFELVIVPDSSPHTKPKALDFALPFVRGDHVVVYDAEDIPDPDQLRLAASRFSAEPALDCVQAELVVDNAAENPLTSLFAAEYGGQFGLMLPALASWRLPMPLGGTSNHFRTQSLREIGGWDAFNVTEDADLGIRLARLRYRSATLASKTFEEAPVTIDTWMGQRTRWMKGWMQTFIVHNRHPLRFLEDIGWRGFLGFQIYVGSMIFTAPLHTVFVVSVFLKLIWLGPDQLLPGGVWSAAYLAVLVLGYIGSFTLSIFGLLRLGRKRLLGWQLALPFYWVLHSVAALIGAYELLTRPYFWSKTRHGLTRMERGETETRRQVSADSAPQIRTDIAEDWSG